MSRDYRIYKQVDGTLDFLDNLILEAKGRHLGAEKLEGFINAVLDDKTNISHSLNKIYREMGDIDKKRVRAYHLRMQRKLNKS